MASEMYPRGLQAFLAGELSWKAASPTDFRVYLLDSTAAFNAAHEDMADITGDKYASGVTGALTSLTNSFTASGVVADCTANPTISSLAQSGSLVVSAMVLFKYASGVEANQTILAYYSASSVTGLPLTPNGGDVTIQWHASGCFKLA